MFKLIIKKYVEILPPTVQNSPYETSDAIRIPLGSFVIFVFILSSLCLL